MVLGALPPMLFSATEAAPGCWKLTLWPVSMLKLFQLMIALSLVCVTVMVLPTVVGAFTAP